MKEMESYTAEVEALDLEVTGFLNDLNIALGHDYQPPGWLPFRQFSFDPGKLITGELPLFEKLAQAYKALDKSHKPHARLVVHKALIRCARSPLGLRRSLACLDLAHEIDPSIGSEELYVDLTLRPNDESELSEWLWQLVRRWHKWNVKVVGNTIFWTTVADKIAPKGIMELLRYFHAQNASENPGCWTFMRRIAIDRIEQEQAALHEVGYDPDIIKENIASLIVPPEPTEESFIQEGATVEHEKMYESLRRTLRRELHQVPPGKIKEETEWLVGQEEAEWADYREAA